MPRNQYPKLPEVPKLYTMPSDLKSLEKCFWEWDLHTDTLLLDSEFDIWFGDSMAQTELDINFWKSRIHPEDRNSVWENLKQAKAVKQKTWHYQYRLLQTNDTYTLIDHQAFILYNQSGKPSRITGSLTGGNKIGSHQHTGSDQLQENISKVRAILEGLPQMAWTASPDGTIDYFTQTWYEYTGQTITEAMNMGCRSALHPHDDERAFPIYTNAIASKQPYDVEKRIRRAIDGQYRWHLVRAMPLFDIDGNITLWAGTCTDIHDQKMVAEELEEKVKQRTIELQQANADLERSNNELEQFAYIASHDLQEPLRKIQILSDRLLLDLAEYYYENAENLTKKIQLAANRMSSLLKELLNYSRLSYKESNPFKKVKLSNALENVFNDLETVITQKKASIRFEALPEIEATELLIIQLFHNLLSNSLKFTAPSRSPLITIFSEELTETEKYAFQLEPSRQYCKIVFQDNGIGFDNQFAGRIFTIFQRLNNVDKFPGTGIGLALCKKIVTNHQGLIFAEAVEGDGATFTIILPYTQVR